jgi:hypothetical protein
VPAGKVDVNVTSICRGPKKSSYLFFCFFLMICGATCSGRCR